MSDYADVENVPLIDENISMIIDVFNNGLLALPESYTAGFENYLKHLSENLPYPDEEVEEFNRFWQLLVITHVSNRWLSIEELHNNWVNACSDVGWTFNTMFDAERKVCPLLITFHNLNIQEASIVRLLAAITWSLVLQDNAEDEEELIPNGPNE